WPGTIAVSQDSDTITVCDYNNHAGHWHSYDVSGSGLTYIDSSVRELGYQTHSITSSWDGAYYVSVSYNSDNITIQNLITGFPVETHGLDVNLTTGIGDPQEVIYGPHGVGVYKTHRDTTLAVVACRRGDDQLRRFDIVSKTLIDSLLIPESSHLDNRGPTMVAISPDNSKAYVTGFGANKLWVIDLAIPMTITETIDFAISRPFSVEVSDDGGRVYVSCIGPIDGKGYVYAINGTTLTKVDSVEVGKQPYGIAWVPK
ncbi:MAG: YncE family protein, partial [candidate division Zixibacteria bacterium]